MSAPKFFLSLSLFFGLFLTSFSAFSQAPKDSHVAMRILPNQTHVKGGDTITVGIEQAIEPGWHTYWINPGDSGTATRVTWEADGIKKEDIKVSDLIWPAPKKLTMGPLTNFGYEDNVILLQDITFPDKIPDETFMLIATVDVLVCQEICIPETHHYSFAINGPSEPVPVAVAMAQTRLPVEVDWTAKIRPFEGKVAFDIEAPDTSVFYKTEKIEVYPEEWGITANTDTPEVVVDDKMISSRHKPGDRALSDIKSSNLIVVYEDMQKQRKAFRVNAIVETDAVQSSGQESADRNVMGIVKAALFALLGGLILNLMPCVFPVLSMKALSLVQLKDEEIAKARWHGIFYTLGILFSFTVVAAVLLSLKAGGAEIGWGFQLQNPLIILGLSYLFFILGLNLSGFFDIDFGLSHVGQALTERAGLSGSFFTGVLATIVATPCTAPFMAGAIGYAITQSAGVAIVVFLALGLGLALPYLLLTMIPALRHALPRPGAWMETFRQFLAFPMFASSLWLVWVLSQQTDHMGIFTALMGLLAIAFALWLFKSRPMNNPGKIIVLILSLLSLGYAVSTFSAVAKNPAPQTPVVTGASGAEVFSQSLLDDYIKQGQPVFVNMTAAWCITCKVNEKVALSSETVEDLFAQKGIKYLKGDWTNQNPEITKFLESYGRSGVPIYVYYGQGKEPVVLPQILTPDIVQKAILGE